MGMTSAAEAKLDARIRPEIALMRSRTSYPKRRLPVAAQARPAAAQAGRAAVEAGRAAAEAGRAAADVTPAAAETGHRVTETGHGAAGAGPAVATARTRATCVPPAVAAARTRAACVPPAVAKGRTRAARVPPAIATAKAPRPGPIRLTRRGRIVAGAAVTVAALTAAGLLWLLAASQARAASHTQPGRAASGQGLIRIVVRPGQSLYSIAMAADPSADPRVIISEIVDENALASTSIQVGQVLWVPRS